MDFEEIVNKTNLGFIECKTEEIFNSNSLEKCWALAKEFYNNSQYQEQELGVFSFAGK